MNRWEAIEAFVAVCEHGTFSKAAEQLGVSKSHISRQVSLLENHLDTLLLNRTTRVVSPTDIGQNFYSTCRSTLESLTEAEQSIIEEHHEARGLLNVSVAGQFGEDYIVPAAIKFMQKYPKVSINLDFSNRLVDLVAEGYDIAIRAGTLKDSSLIARRIAPRKLLICGSPNYFSRCGQPQNIQELRQHNCLLGTRQTWRLKDENQHLDLRMEGNWQSNNGQALVLAALEGLGLVQLPSYYLKSHIEKGALRTTLEKHNPTDTGTWAVYPSNRHMSQKVRLFINFLVEELSHL